MDNKISLLDDALLTLQNEGELYRKLQKVEDSNHGINVGWSYVANCYPKWCFLSKAQQAYIFFVLWEWVGKDTLTLSKRHEDYHHSILAEFWKKHYQESQAEKNLNLVAQYLNETTQQEKQEMNATTSTPAFQTKHYVFGQDTTTMTEEQLISAVQSVENEISNLKGIKTKSKAIDKKIVAWQTMLDSIVEVLDNR